MVLRNYFYAVLGTTILSGLAFGLAYTIDTVYPLPNLVINLIQVLGIIFSASAVYGQLGWKIQTWGG